MDGQVQSHLQHYSEPIPYIIGGTASPSTTPAMQNIASAYGGGPLLPLGPGTLTLNRSVGDPSPLSLLPADRPGVQERRADHSGVHASRLDGYCRRRIGDESRLGGTHGLGTTSDPNHLPQLYVCFASDSQPTPSPSRDSVIYTEMTPTIDGAALFYTASTQPQTYTLLRTYLLHRLYTPPPPLNPSTDAPPQPTSSRFPFPRRANVLDRDAVMVPSGWDSWGKINVLRDGFDPARVGRAWEVSLRGEGGEEEGIEDLWLAMIPDAERRPKVSPTQSYLSNIEAYSSPLFSWLLGCLGSWVLGIFSPTTQTPSPPPPSPNRPSSHANSSSSSKTPTATHAHHSETQQQPSPPPRQTETLARGGTRA